MHAFSCQTPPLPSPFCLFKYLDLLQLAGQQLHIPGPAPPLDLSRYLHVSGFPSAARTAVVMAPLKTVTECERSWFHWIDDTSGAVELKSALHANAVLVASASARAGAALMEEESEFPRVVNPEQLLLEDMKIVPLDFSILHSDNGGQEGGERGEEQRRKAKRPRQASEPAGDAMVV